MEGLKHVDGVEYDRNKTLMQVSEMDDVAIKLKGDGTVEVTTCDNGCYESKTISYSSFMALLTASNEENKVTGTAELELFPMNEDIKVIAHYKKDDLEAIAFVKEPCIRKVKYYDNSFENIPIPKLLFIAKIKSGVHIGSSVFALKAKTIKKNTKVYRFPYPNVFSGGKICYGNNSITDADFGNIETISRLANMFLEMPFNDHNSAGANKTKMPPRKLFESLSGKDIVDCNKIMLPLGKTIEEIIKNYR